MAVWMALAGRSVVDKAVAIVFPISAFVAAGFEHSVANMYLIPIAMFLQTFEHIGVNANTITWAGLFTTWCRLYWVISSAAACWWGSCITSSTDGRRI